MSGVAAAGSVTTARGLLPKFAVAHEEILPLVLIACTALIFLVWARYLTASAESAPVASTGS